MRNSYRKGNKKNLCSWFPILNRFIIQVAYLYVNIKEWEIEKSGPNTIQFVLT